MLIIGGGGDPLLNVFSAKSSQHLNVNYEYVCLQSNWSQKTGSNLDQSDRGER